MITEHALTERTSSYEFLWTKYGGNGGGLTADYYINYLQLSLWIVELFKSNVISVILLLNLSQNNLMNGDDGKSYESDFPCLLEEKKEKLIDTRNIDVRAKNLKSHSIIY